MEKWGEVTRVFLWSTTNKQTKNSIGREQNRIGVKEKGKVKFISKFF